MKKPNYFRSLLFCGFSLLMVGCGKSALYSNVSERQANEMISLLRIRNMEVSKAAGAENMWTVYVGNNDFSGAVEVLNTYGYPKDEFVTMGKAFQKSGLVSSPTEERARYMHALSENIAETISHIHGVVTARVNIVLPTVNAYTESVTPSSASVFILYRQGVNIEDFIRDIKHLVTNSIEGLTYDKVSVALFTAPAISDDMFQSTKMINILGVRIAHASLWSFLMLFLLVIVAVALLSFVGAKILYDYMTVKRDEKERRNSSQKKKKEEQEEKTEPSEEE
ncbi:MAG: type III secretion inner membrane ring lipoprotein SctJ [Puniceicoccales bacterium]|nr:type III secretion inner membrane ring lipoprotein SctJ [Puniceicoccales bacterium]